MRHIRQVAISAFLCAMVSGWAFAQSANVEGTGLSAERLRRINDMIERRVEAKDISGAVTLVARRGRIAHLVAQGLMDKGWPLLEAGKIKPIIYKTFPLTDAAGAHAELERADHVGKVMLTV